MKVAKFTLGTMGTNCYFLIDEGSGTAAVVDPGAECGKILQKLSERALRCDKILLTHAHFDHIGALNELREATGAPLYCHKYDTELLADPEKSLMSRFAPGAPACLPPDIGLDEGDTIIIGTDTLKVLHTPGHTTGSVCYDDGLHLISGDTLFRGGIGRYDFYGGDYDTLCASLRRIAALEGDRVVYPGHGPTTHLSEERENNIYLR